MADVAISAALVSQLRAETGAGMMDCKQALVESGGDKDKAVEYLRKKGKAAAEKRADRAANEGVVAIVRSEDGQTAAMVEVNSETDFVAKNDDFRKFADELAKLVLGWGDAAGKSVDDLKQRTLGARTVGDSLTDLIGKIGEKLEIRRFARMQSAGGFVGYYVHGDNKLGTLVGLQGITSQHAEAGPLGKDLAMQVAASSPLVVRREQVDAAKLDAERAIEIARAREEGKPEAAVAKIAEGRINKWLAEVALLEQPFVKDPKVAVKSLLEGASKAVGGAVDVQSFERFRVGS
ncbi:elongation factor Ts [candidate division KSB1 bacterium]|nr:elongation factor Ts [candidate division KSB1 bacterium]